MAASVGADRAAATGEGAKTMGAGSNYLDEAVETVNRQIDNDIKAMLDAFDALVGLSAINDKDRFRIAQESFEAEARADSMVRAAQSLTLLSHSLKLSLLLAQEPICNEEREPSTDDGAEATGDADTAPRRTTLDEEAIMLIKSTAAARRRCAQSLLILCNKGPSKQSTPDAQHSLDTKSNQAGSRDDVEMREGQ